MIQTETLKKWQSACRMQALKRLQYMGVPVRKCIKGHADWELIGKVKNNPAHKNTHFWQRRYRQPGESFRI